MGIKFPPAVILPNIYLLVLSFVYIYIFLIMYCYLGN